MEMLFSLILIIYPVNDTTHTKVADKIEIKNNMSKESCISIMLEIQDQISEQSNVDFQCQSE